MDKVKEMPEADRPYEKCMNYGASVLTDTELLAIILRNGTSGSSALTVAGNILKASGNDASVAVLENLTFEELTGIKGIGRVKALQLLCLTEFSKRMWRSRHSRRNFRRSKEIADYYMEHMRYLEHEEVYIMLLDNRCSFIGDFRLSSGTVDSSLVSVRDIFMNSLRRGAVKIAMIHNHPGGDPTPSKADIEVTKKIMEAGKLVDISLIDSIIIGDGIYISLFDETDFL